jgi:putative hemolysin
MKIKRSKDFKRWKIEHNRVLFYVILFLIAVLIFVIFQIKHLNNEKDSALNNETGNITHDIGSNVGIANPASVYCINQSGKLEIRSDEQGNQYGVCIFNDGSECEEWKYFRGDCKLGDSLI